jgi:hypothetical protein
VENLSLPISPASFLINCQGNTVSCESDRATKDLIQRPGNVETANRATVAARSKYDAMFKKGLLVAERIHKSKRLGVGRHFYALIDGLGDEKSLCLEFEQAQGEVRRTEAVKIQASLKLSNAIMGLQCAP